MSRPPRKTNESLFADEIGFHIIWVGILMAALTLVTQAWAINTENTHWQTMVFTVLSFAQLAHVLAIRSDYEFVYKKGLLSNRFLIASILLTFVLQLGVIYLPFANSIFKTQPLTMFELVLCILIATILFHAVEMEKWMKKRMRKNQ